MSISKYFTAAALALCATFCARELVFAKGSVLNSPHNLSISGGGGAHAISFGEIRVCVFCHTPHNAVANSDSAPLWNRALPAAGQSYSMYQSDFFNQNVNPRPLYPTGSSRVCLSCHDGTLALNRYGGKVLSDTGVPEAATTMPGDTDRTKNANLTTDLSDDHPISFPYTDDLAAKVELVSPTALPPNIKLDKNNNLQCTACHDPHDNEYGNFLVMNNGDPTKPDYNPNVTSPLCVACHTPSGWDATSPHYAGAGCLNCHASHTSPVKEYLLNAPVDQVCFNGTGCHGTGNPAAHPVPTQMIAQSKQLNSSVARPASAAPARQRGLFDMQSLFGQSLYKHPVGQVKTPYKRNERLPLKQPRVECVDCHNSHLTGSAMPGAGTMKRSLKKVRGVNKDSMATVEATREYEICYKCHSGPYALKFIGLDKENRVIQDADLRKRFDIGNPSFHPVAATRRGTGASLLAQYQTTMLTIECTDCHNSDQSRKAGGSGPNGPHASRYEHILIARYEMPPTQGAMGRANQCGSYRSDYALCFICHSDDYVMVSGSKFRNGSANQHAKHVVDQCIPCFACHDPHGVSTQDGATVTNNSFLMNFDKFYASSQSVPFPRYTMTGTGGSCTVSCHPTGMGYDRNVAVMPRRVPRFR
ncbi:cytochrome c3 family protein [Geomesophilobacter sediminis]|uniref:Doubled CXXCH motif domain-containing protein n=1 Tax=Geomesophilobacter sediminis TaxID=2798584 RepID=A0A8J7SA49_9BACT|nr:cytochrome c3 family protein [Geomesophilobacter sediminis]MBJ6727270.1 hypothetical protein [Geomesophilobacter sediminis]